MKNFGSIMDFTHQRNEDLMETFRRVLSSVEFVDMPTIFQLVADSPSKRFWVSEERASIVISAMVSGKPLPRMRANKREMFDEIFRRFKILKKDFPDRCLFEIVSMIVREPAPKFYLTARTVGEFIYRIKNGWYDGGQTDESDNS